MDIVMYTYYSDASGVVDDLTGKERSCLVVDNDNILLLVGEILSALAQGCDIKISHFER